MAADHKVFARLDDAVIGEARQLSPLAVGFELLSKGDALAGNLAVLYGQLFPREAANLLDQQVVALMQPLVDMATIRVGKNQVLTSALFLLAIQSTTEKHPMVKGRTGRDQQMRGQP